MEEINNRPMSLTFSWAVGIKRSDIAAHTSEWELMLTETVTITQRGQNRMLVRWESPKCQTAYRLLSPCNLNSQHQSDKLSDRPREWRTCLRRTHVQRQQWKKGKKKNNKNPNPTYHDGRKEEMWMFWLELVQSAGFSPLNSTPLFWIYSSDSSPGSVTGAVQRVHSKVQLR